MIHGKNEVMVSVIIPVYNAEKYLHYLIETLIKQTLHDIEFIFVNDGSTDNSLKILNTFKEKDRRIKIINKENTGVSASRNIGLKMAKGRYITFADADDFIAENMYEVLLKNAVVKNADIVSCGYYVYTKECKSPMLNQTEKILSREEAIEDLLQVNLLGMSIWNKLFKKTCLTEVLFNEKYKTNEDRLFSFYAIKNSNRIAVIKNPLYYYRLNPDSVSHAFFNISKMDGLLISKEMYEIVKDEFPSLKDESYTDIVRIAYLILILVYKDRAWSQFPIEYKNLIGEIKHADFSIIKKYTSKSNYIQLLCVKYFEKVFKYIKIYSINRKK